MSKIESLKGYGRFLVAAYKQSTARRAFCLVTITTEVAGILGLLGITLVLIDATTLPLWVPFVVTTAALVVGFLSVLQGAYVLWYNLAEDAGELAATSEPSPPQTRVRIHGLTIRDSGGDGVRLGKGVEFSADSYLGERIGGHGINAE
jgi:hypothetical protein